MHGFRCYDKIARTRNVSECLSTRSMPGVIAVASFSTSVHAYDMIVFIIQLITVHMIRTRCSFCLLYAVKRTIIY